MNSTNDEHASSTRKVKPTSLNVWVMGQVFMHADEVPNRFTPNRRNHLLRLVNAGLVEIAGSTLRLTAEGRAAMPARVKGNDEIANTNQREGTTHSQILTTTPEKESE